MQEYTHDYLLDKRVKIFQPVDGYRASTDAVILSSIIGSLKKNDNILDVGSGTGAIALCLAERFKEQKPEIIGLELQHQLAKLSNLSAEINGFADFLQFIYTDINHKISSLSPCSFAHVISNPPYTDHDMPSPKLGKALAHNGQDFSLTTWIKFCIKMLQPQGYFYMINRAEAITEILAALHGKMGEINIIPLYSKKNQNAKRIIITARKDSKAPTTIHPGLVIHEENGEYTPIAHHILREGQTFFEATKN